MVTRAIIVLLLKPTQIHFDKIFDTNAIAFASPDKSNKGSQMIMVAELKMKRCVYTNKNAQESASRRRRNSSREFENVTVLINWLTIVACLGKGRLATNLVVISMVDGAD